MLTVSMSFITLCVQWYSLHCLGHWQLYPPGPWSRVHHPPERWFPFVDFPPPPAWNWVLPQTISVCRLPQAPQTTKWMRCSDLQTAFWTQRDSPQRANPPPLSSSPGKGTQPDKKKGEPAHPYVWSPREFLPWTGPPTRHQWLMGPGVGQGGKKLSPHFPHLHEVGRIPAVP